MCGQDTQQAGMFSYLSPEERVPATHPLRPIGQYVDTALPALSPRSERLYARTGRPSIAPEKLLRALLLQVLYSLRSERLVMEELQYNLLFRWVVGLDLDAPVWDVTVFTKNRDRLVAGQIATAFFKHVLAQVQRLLSDEHFTVDGTLIEAWAGQRSFKVRRRQNWHRPHQRMIRGTPASTSEASGGRMRRTPQRPIQRPGVDAVLWIARTGAHWRELPERFGAWHSVFQRDNRWSNAGVWARVFRALSGDPDFENR